ncbi:replication protein [Entomohabitans teleogrylli]|uniref:replication protein n=1 Tax=Entomohabitans teleogrylli TaxID=1384589 RepID=UPI00073D349C|nr:replication protein [Entomohabitans teleogrylli]
MTNAAKVIKFPGPEPAWKEQRVADTDDGFTRLANELYEELIGANLTRNQAKVAHAVCRKTYGFNKRMDRIADAQIAQLTRLPRQKVNAVKNELIGMRVLITEGGLIGPNKNLNEWNIPPVKSGPKCHHDSYSHHDSDTVPTIVTKIVTKTVTDLSPKQGHTKDTITKDNKDNINIPPIVPLESAKKKPVKRATQFPVGFTPTDGNRTLAENLGVDLRGEMEAFADYHQSKGSTFRDWSLALNTWLRNAAKFGRSTPPAAKRRPAPEGFAEKNYGQTEIPSWMEE